MCSAAVSKKLDWETSNPNNWPILSKPGYPENYYTSQIHVLGPFADKKYQLYKWVPQNRKINEHWVSFGSNAKYPPEEMALSLYVGPLDKFILGIEGL